MKSSFAVTVAVFVAMLFSVVRGGVAKSATCEGNGHEHVYEHGVDNATNQSSCGSVSPLGATFLYGTSSEFQANVTQLIAGFREARAAGVVGSAGSATAVQVRKGQPQTPELFEELIRTEHRRWALREKALYDARMHFKTSTLVFLGR
jgi:hypothetical protein